MSRDVASYSGMSLSGLIISRGQISLEQCENKRDINGISRERGQRETTYDFQLFTISKISFVWLM